MRCGKCSGVFDGISQLVSEAEADASQIPPSRADGIPAAPSAVASELHDSPEPVTLPNADLESVIPSSSKYVGALATADASPVTIERPEKIVVPAFLAPERPQVAHTLIWVTLSIVAVATLALQAALHFRTEIAVLLPSARVYLETACDALGCDVRLPRRADLMSIESSDLQADSQRAGVIVLNALLRNRAPFAQEYPDLELTLTDQGDRAVVRRVLAPSDYLQEKRAVLPLGLAGGAEESVRIFLDTGGVAATGYQLFLFYSCPPLPSSRFWQLSYPSRCQEPRNN